MHQAEGWPTRKGKRSVTNITHSCQHENQTLGVASFSMLTCRFSSVPWQTGPSGGHDSAEILFLAFLQTALVSSLGMGMAGMSTLWCCPCSNSPANRSVTHPLKAPWWMVLERLPWCVTCLNHASFCLPYKPYQDLCLQSLQVSKQWSWTVTADDFLTRCGHCCRLKKKMWRESNPLLNSVQVSD